MAFYDRISSKWHKITGYKGGSFKELILNDKVIQKIESIDGKTIVELGAGNGYFMPLLLRKKSGQQPSTIIITDISGKQLENAKKHFNIHNAIYERLDITKKFMYKPQRIDIIIAIMVFNELSNEGLNNALAECRRVLKKGGQLVACFLHPDFVDKQIERGVIKKNLMVSKGGLKVPVRKRTRATYIELFENNGFICEHEEVFGNPKLYNMKPKLKEIKNIPIALIVNAC